MSSETGPEVLDERYEWRVRNARTLLKDAYGGRALPGGTTGNCGRYKRITHYGRIVDAQDARIHRICLLDADAQICTCGVRVPVDSDDVFAMRGHLDTRFWQPVDVFVAEQEPHTEVFKRRYAVVCQLCSSVSATTDLQGAQFDLASHRHLR